MTPNGAAIRAIRKLQGMPLRQLANLTGRDPGYLWRVESDIQGASRETVRRIAEVLNIPEAAITRERPCDQERPGPAPN
ncbi:helix-turn-helix domain-containing protein [Streptomyces sp. NPDC012888]|uniref:helix-turn-helix domain-containing protein n=1 Tax=Streptomyces sp. NPDC012888 TaxID=3364855 RepID=UPI0036C2666B